MGYLIRRGIQNSAVTDVSMDLKEMPNGDFIFDIKSKVLVSTNRPIVRPKGKGSKYLTMIFLISISLMLTLAVIGMLDHDPIGGRSIVSYSLYPSFIVNTLGARYVIRKLT
jgi:hypothetical protein